MSTEWKLAPRKPNDAMLEAAVAAWTRDPLRRSSTLWTAMWDAAPETPAPPHVDDDTEDMANVGRVLMAAFANLAKRDADHTAAQSNNEPKGGA